MHLINRLCIIRKEEFILIGLHLFCDLKSSLNFHYSAQSKQAIYTDVFNNKWLLKSNEYG